MSYDKYSKSPHVCVGIVSWQDMHHKAENIARSIDEIGIDVYVVHSDSSGDRKFGSGTWITVSNDYYWGMKFNTILRLADGYHACLIIQADVVCEDWIKVLHLFVSNLMQCSSLGLWTVDVNYSYYDFLSSSIYRSSEVEYCVLITDGLVWGLSRSIMDSMKTLDYSDNKFGWGIEIAAAVFAILQARVAILDKSIHLEHPQGSAYPKKNAREDQARFLLQLPLLQRSIAKLIFGFIAFRKGYGFNIKSSLAYLLIHLLSLPSLLRYKVNSLRYYALNS